VVVALFRSTIPICVWKNRGETTENLRIVGLWIRTRDLPNTRQRSLRIGVDCLCCFVILLEDGQEAMTLVQLKFNGTVASNNF
jgi:hypothetical protein